MVQALETIEAMNAPTTLDPTIPASHISRIPWLRDIKKAFEVADHVFGTQKDMFDSPCKRGCYVCCKHNDVPVLKIEIAAIAYYYSEIMDDETADKISNALKRSRSVKACPFLLDGECSIYPMRPLACRRYYLKRGPPCKEEDGGSVSVANILIGSTDGNMAVTLLMASADRWTDPESTNPERFISKLEENLLESTVPLHEAHLERLPGTRRMIKLVMRT